MSKENVGMSEECRSDGPVAECGERLSDGVPEHNMADEPFLDEEKPLSQFSSGWRNDDAYRRKYRSATTHLLCGIYCMVIVVIGLVFPVSTSLVSNGPNDASYLLVFHLYIYVIALTFLIYLHCYVLRHREEDDANTRHISLVSNNQLDNAEKFAMHDMVSGGGKENMSVRSRTLSRGTDHDLDTYNTSPKVCRENEGVNFYLRLGAIVFGTGSMIHDGFKIATLFEGSLLSSLDCHGPLYIFVAVVHMIFTFVQTYFLFKSHGIVINMHKAAVRFGFVHLVATNFCVWSMVTVLETNEAMHQHYGHLDHGEVNDIVTDVTATLQPNYTDYTPHGGNRSTLCALDRSLAWKAAPYLFPCTVEYTLIAAAMAHKMYKNVGRVPKHILTEEDDSKPKTTDCDKANKGLFLGLFITILTLISVSCFFLFDGQTQFTKDFILSSNLVFHVTELMLLLLSCIVVIVGFCKFQQLRFLSDQEDTFNSRLLMVSFFGLLLFNGFVIVSSIGNIDFYGLISFLVLGTALLSFIQSGLQTIFIMDGLRRCSESPEQVARKPGRALVTFLLLCNLSLWVVAIFEDKKTNSVPLHDNFYGYLAWNIISHLCIPFIIFFRFHSTVCLSDIWVNAYRIKGKEQQV